MSEFLGTVSVLVGFSCVTFAAFLFMAKSERKLPNQFFGVFLILTAIDVSGWVILGSGLETSWLEAFRSVIGAFQMPLFLCFIASACYSNFKLTKWDILHALPFLLGLYLTLPGNQLFWGDRGTAAQALYLTETETIFRLITSHIQYYLYITAAVYILWRFRQVFRQHYADARSDVFVWLSRILLKKSADFWFKS